MNRFNPGQVVATPGALAAFEASGESLLDYLQRHVSGDLSLADSPSTAFEQFVDLFAPSLNADTLFSFLLPRPLFRGLFRIAFPFMPERLEDFNDQD